MEREKFKSLLVEILEDVDNDQLDLLEFHFDRMYEDLEGGEDITKSKPDQKGHKALLGGVEVLLLLSIAQSTFTTVKTFLEIKKLKAKSGEISEEQKRIIVEAMSGELTEKQKEIIVEAMNGELTEDQKKLFWEIELKKKKVDKTTAEQIVKNHDLN